MKMLLGVVIFLSVQTAYPMANIDLDRIVESNGHKYRHFRIAATWHEAKKSCEKFGAYLATITDQAEQDFLLELLDGRVAWIGASDEANEGTWRWVTGEPMEYTAWLPKEPNNRFGWEHGLGIGYQNNGKLSGWNDWVLGGRIGYICEWGF